MLVKNPKLAIIVPYRDREEHLARFVPHMDKFLSDADNYKIMSSMDKGVDTPIVEISYRNDYDQDKNNKRILLCEYGNGSNLWSIDFDDSLIDLEPSEILGFGNYKKGGK